MSLPLRILLRAILSILLVWALTAYLPQYITMTGGWPAFVVVGALLTLLNLLVRPILDLITLPLRLFATLLAFILANGIFLWITLWIVQRMEPTIVTLSIRGGIVGWLVMMFAIGLSNWVLKHLL